MTGMERAMMELFLVILKHAAREDDKERAKELLEDTSVAIQNSIHFTEEVRELTDVVRRARTRKEG